MKKIIRNVATVLMLASFAFGITACTQKEAEKTQKEPSQIEQVYAQYVIYAQAEGATPLSYEEWLTSIKGETGRGIAKTEIIDGCLWVTYTDSETPVNVGALVEAQEQGTDGLAYYPLPDGTYAVAQGNTVYLEEIVIPATYKGKAVTTIMENAFTGISLMPDSAIYVNMKRITIPDSVTTIGDYAFYGCDDLTGVTIPDSVTTIGTSAFSGCSSLTSITIPDSVTTIGDRAFSYCDGLTSVTIPDSVTTIGNSTFQTCVNLTYNVYENAKYLGNDDNPYMVLINTQEKSQSMYQIHEQTKFISDSAFSDCRSLTSITIPDSVTTIGTSAFSGCSSLTSITISDSVTTIGESAFTRCSSLTSITIPNGVTCIDRDTFSRCSNLKNVTIGNNITSIGYDAFSDCSSLTNVTMGDSVETIGASAFFGCTSLKSITIPNSVTLIEDRAFYSCASLTSITIPNGITSIGFYTFSYCSSLKSVALPDNVTLINEGAFESCFNLTSIIIPDGVTSIDSGSFYNCSNLTSVYYKGTAEDWAKMEIDRYNDALTKATLYYYSETTPTAEGNYWYYDKNGNVAVWEL